MAETSPVPADSTLNSEVAEFSNQSEDPGRIVGRTRLIWRTRRWVIVSTVFVPWADGDVVLQWETMVIGDDVTRLPAPMDAVQWGDIGGRYPNRDDAVIGHRRWCQLVAGWLNHVGRPTVTWQEMTTW